MDEQPQLTRQADSRPTLRLAIFDLDGTLKEASSPWMYLHYALGTAEEAEKYRQWFYAGKIDYREWARLDSALWKGVELARVEAIFRDSTYRPGVHELFRFLQRHGVLTAVISTGLGVQARQVAAELGMWRTIANELAVKDGRLVGETIVNVEEHTKGQLVAQLQQEAGVLNAECLAVGDGPADIDMFAGAGLAIAVCPRNEKVRQAAHHVLEDGDLSRAIPLIERHFALKEQP